LKLGKCISNSEGKSAPVILEYSSGTEYKLAGAAFHRIPLKLGNIRFGASSESENRKYYDAFSLDLKAPLGEFLRDEVSPDMPSSMRQSIVCTAKIDNSQRLGTYSFSNFGEANSTDELNVIIHRASSDACILWSHGAITFDDIDTPYIRKNLDPSFNLELHLNEDFFDQLWTVLWDDHRQSAVEVEIKPSSPQLFVSETYTDFGQTIKYLENPSVIEDYELFHLPICVDRQGYPARYSLPFTIGFTSDSEKSSQHFSNVGDDLETDQSASGEFATAHESELDIKMPSLQEQCEKSSRGRISNFLLFAILIVLIIELIK